MSDDDELDELERELRETEDPHEDDVDEDGEAQPELDDDSPDSHEDDAVACDRCGDFHDPADLMAFEDQQMCEPCVHATCSKPWNPRGIGALSFLLGFGGAGVVHAINQRRLGYDVRVAPRAVMWLVGFAAALAIFSFLPEGAGRVAGIGMNVGALLYFSRSGATRYEAYKAAGGETGSWLAPVGIAVGTLVAAAVVVFGALFAYGTARFEQGQAMLDEGDYDGADDLFREECEAGDPAACTNVGWIAEQRQDYVLARSYYRRACGDDEPMGCNNLGLLMEAGRGGPPDLEQARRFYRMACDLEEPTGCDNLRAVGTR